MPGRRFATVVIGKVGFLIRSSHTGFPTGPSLCNIWQNRSKKRAFRETSGLALLMLESVRVLFSDATGANRTDMTSDFHVPSPTLWQIASSGPSNEPSRLDRRGNDREHFAARAADSNVPGIVTVIGSPKCWSPNC